MTVRLAVMVLLLGTVRGGDGQGIPPVVDKVPTAVYTDQAGRVSFRYPAVWTLSNQTGSYLPMLIAPSGQAVEAAVTFSPKGNLYEKTTLAGLRFSYRRVPASAAGDCVPMLGEIIAKPEQAAINGVPFTRFAAGDAGMSHSVSETVYVTFRNRTCYLFEEDLEQEMANVGQGVRMLTKAEVMALRRHLDDVMQTVTFGR